MNRRILLRTTAGASVATAFGTRTPIPALAAPGQIKHIVHVMMENRSFDHMMGWFPNAGGKQAGLTYLDKNGNPQSTHRLAPDWTGCGHPDPDHSYTGAHLEYNNGLMNSHRELRVSAEGLRK